MKCLECRRNDIDLGHLMSDGESEFLKYTCEFCGAEYHEYSKTRVWFLDSNGENPRWLTQTEIEKLHEREQKVEFTKTV